jgi:hypothetical protein
MDIASRAGLLRANGRASRPLREGPRPHNWWDWYATYMDAREHGSTPDEASKAAGREEIIYILEGSLKYQIEGPPTRTPCSVTP